MVPPSASPTSPARKQSGLRPCAFSRVGSLDPRPPPARDFFPSPADTQRRDWPDRLLHRHPDRLPTAEGPRGSGHTGHRMPTAAGQVGVGGACASRVQALTGLSAAGTSWGRGRRPFCTRSCLSGSSPREGVCTRVSAWGPGVPRARLWAQPRLRCCFGFVWLFPKSLLRGEVGSRRWLILDTRQ